MLDKTKPPFMHLVDRAAEVLAGDGWRVLRRVSDPEAPWHLVVRKATRLRVIQVEEPATPPAHRQEARIALGAAARLPSSLGTMEQWLAHVRPNGYVTFGPYLLNAQRWAGTDVHDFGLVYEQLGIARNAA
jgi:hypothetical protein